MAARVRTLADAVGDLTAEISQARAAARAIDMSKLDGQAKRVAERFARAIETLAAELGTTNQQLLRLSRTPLLGMLGGGADAEINRLVSKVDTLRGELGGWRDLVPR